MRRAAVLTALALVLAGCVHKPRLAPVVATATIPPAPTPIPRSAATAIQAARAFSTAFVAGRTRVAQGYLAPGLRAKSAVIPLAVDLGVEGRPLSYRLAPTQPAFGQETITARYVYAGGSSTVRLLLQRGGRGWQVAAISRVRR